jgi:Uma2 family endonuclease
MKTLEQNLEAPIPPTLKRWKIEECETLQKMGLIEGRYELLEGMIIDKMGSGGKHSKLICLLLIALTRVFGVERMRVQLPIRVAGDHGRYNQPEPDVAVTREAASAYNENPLAADLLLAAEVSDSSLHSDMTTKARLYARVGIPEYWVIDAEGERLVVHREPTESGYAEITEWRAGEAVSPLASPTAPIAVSELLPENDD